MTIKFKTFWLASTLLMLLCNSLIASALNLSAEVYTNVGYTDNAKLDSEGAVDDIFQVLGVDLGVLVERKNFQADANLVLEEEHYFNNTYSDQTSVTTGFGLFNFNLVDSLLNWRSSFTRSEVLTDSSEDATPDNREHKDILRTGPSMLFRPSENSTVGISTEYATVESSDVGAFDTDRVTGGLNLGYAVNKVTRFSINAQYSDVIDGDGSEEYKNGNVNIGLNRRFSRGSLEANYGRTRVIPEHFDTTDSNFYRLALSREDVMWHDVSLRFDQDISDTSIGFETNNQERSADQTDPLKSASGGDVVERQRVTLNVVRVVDSYDYLVDWFWEYDDYLSVGGSDERSRGFVFRLDKQISPGLTYGFQYSLRINDFVDRPELRKDTRNIYTVDSVYELSPSLSVSGYLRFSDRANSTNHTREYEEFSTWLSLRWKLL